MSLGECSSRSEPATAAKSKLFDVPNKIYGESSMKFGPNTWNASNIPHTTDEWTAEHWINHKRIIRAMCVVYEFAVVFVWVFVNGECVWVHSALNSRGRNDNFLHGWKPKHTNYVLLYDGFFSDFPCHCWWRVAVTLHIALHIPRNLISYKLHNTHGNQKKSRIIGLAARRPSSTFSFQCQSVYHDKSSWI